MPDGVDRAIIPPGEVPPQVDYCRVKMDDVADALVAEINAVANAATLARAVAVGNLVLSRLFNSSLEDYESRRNHHMTYWAVEEHPRLQVTKTYLWYAVTTVRHLRELPVPVAQKLCLAHHRLLAHVHSASLRSKLAAAVASDGLTKRQLERRIRQVQPAREGERRGRPRLPSWSRRPGAIHAMTKELQKEPISERHVVQVGIDASRLRLGEIKEAIRAFEDVSEQLAKVISMAEVNQGADRKS